jgi:hypothetical protein
VIERCASTQAGRSWAPAFAGEAIRRGSDKRERLRTPSRAPGSPLSVQNKKNPASLSGDRVFLNSALAGEAYLSIALTTPAPTVRPPSRIVKRWPTSMAIGAMSLMPSATLSPGITISVPSGSSTVPVTSVVRK